MTVFEPARGTANVSKHSRLIALLQRTEGATIEELMVVTNWQKHSVRGAMSGVLKKRLGLEIVSNIEARGRVYRIVAHMEKVQ